MIVRRTRFRLRKAQERAHILVGLLKALDAIDEVIALIRRSPTVDAARSGLIELLEIDEVQANAILEMQLRRLAALERQRIEDEHDDLMAKIAEYPAILESPERQRRIVSEELQAIVDKYGDERRSQLVPYEGDMSIEDLIPEEDIVVTITRGGYAKRTKTDLYRSQKRGGKGVQRRAAEAGRHRRPLLHHHHAPLDPVLHEQGPGLPGQGARAAGHGPRRARPARGRTCWPSSRTRTSPRCSTCATTSSRPYLVLATKNGLVKKTPLKDYDSPRSAGVIAINLREDDELIAAELVSAEDDLLLVSKQAQAIRLHRDRRVAAADGPGHLGRDRHALPRGRRTAVDGRGPAGHLRVHGDLRRLRQAHRGGRCTRCAAAAAWA